MSIHRIVCLNDIQAGSVWGLWPKIFVTKHGNIIKQNMIQRSLYDNWVKNAKKFRRKKVNSIFLLSENIEGLGYAKYGRELTTTDLDEQTDAAVNLLKIFTKHHPEANIYVFTGSNYHLSKHADYDKTVADDLGGQWMGVGPADFNVNGRIINAGHGDGAVYWYRATKLDKMGFAEQLAVACRKRYKADLILRGHYHFYGWLEYPTQIMTISPCWQAQTDYMKKKDPFKFIPDIGCLEITVSDRGDIGHKVHLYDNPPKQIINLENPKQIHVYSNCKLPKEQIFRGGIKKQCLS